GIGLWMVLRVSLLVFRFLYVLPFAGGDAAQRAGCEQLLEFPPPVGQPVFVGILEQRLDRRPVRLDPVGEPVRPQDCPFLFEQRLQPRRGHFWRAHVRQQVIGVVLGAAERLVHAQRHPERPYHVAPPPRPLPATRGGVAVA